jgi:hypothetical protein
LGFDHGMDDDDVYLGQGKNRIPRVSYDKDKNNGDLSSIDIYKQYLDDDDEDNDDNQQLIPYDAEQRQVKLDRYVKWEREWCSPKTCSLISLLLALRLLC